MHKFLLRISELLFQRIDQFLDTLDFAVTCLCHFRAVILQEIHAIFRPRKIRVERWPSRVDDDSDFFLDVALALSLLLLHFVQFVCRSDDFLFDRSLLLLNIKY